MTAQSLLQPHSSRRRRRLRRRTTALKSRLTLRLTAGSRSRPMTKSSMRAPWKKGDSQTWKGTDKVTVRVGDAGAVSFSVNGKLNLGTAGKTGQLPIRRSRRMAPDAGDSTDLPTRHGRARLAPSSISSSSRVMPMSTTRVSARPSSAGCSRSTATRSASSRSRTGIRRRTLTAWCRASATSSRLATWILA